MVKHVKLFENWASSKIKLPEYLDKNWTPQKKMYGKNIYHFSIQEHAIPNIDLTLDLVNMKSFSDYSFWRKDGYKSIFLNQIPSTKYKLEDCYGIPDTIRLEMRGTDLKSFKGLENREFNVLSIYESKIENLKYLPTVRAFYALDKVPLLSFYGIKPTKILICQSRTFTGV